MHLVHLLEADLSSVLSETSSAEHQAVLADQAVVVGAYAAEIDKKELRLRPGESGFSTTFTSGETSNDEQRQSSTNPVGSS